MSLKPGGDPAIPDVGGDDRVDVPVPVRQPLMVPAQDETLVPRPRRRAHQPHDLPVDHAERLLLLRRQFGAEPGADLSSLARYAAMPCSPKAGP